MTAGLRLSRSPALTGRLESGPPRRFAGRGRFVCSREGGRTAIRPESPFLRSCVPRALDGVVLELNHHGCTVTIVLNSEAGEPRDEPHTFEKLAQTHKMEYTVTDGS